MSRLNLAVLLVLAVPAAAFAAPTMAFTWDGCAGPIQKDAGKAGTYSIYITATGMDQPHWAYEAQLLYANAGGTVPDAWRFDEKGCQGKSLVSFHDAPSARECPPLYGDAPILSIHALRPRNAEDPGEAGTTANLLLIAVAYKKAVTSDPNQRYFLGRVDFDHAASVTGAGKAGETCGGFGEGIAFVPVATRCNYVVRDSTGERHEMRFTVPDAPLTFGRIQSGSRWGRIQTQTGLPR